MSGSFVRAEIIQKNKKINSNSNNKNTSCFSFALVMYVCLCFLFLVCYPIDWLKSIIHLPIKSSKEQREIEENKSISSIFHWANLCLRAFLLLLPYFWWWNSSNRVCVCMWLTYLLFLLFVEIAKLNYGHSDTAAAAVASFGHCFTAGRQPYIDIKT